jgi:hypothetical protein
LIVDKHHGSQVLEADARRLRYRSYDDYHMKQSRSWHGAKLI